MKVINQKNDVVASGLTLGQATEVVRDMYGTLGLRKESTGIAVVCSHAVCNLKRFELDYILDNTFDKFRGFDYDTVQGAYEISDSLYKQIKSLPHFYIVNE